MKATGVTFVRLGMRGMRQGRSMLRILLRVELTFVGVVLVGVDHARQWDDSLGETLGLLVLRVRAAETRVRLSLTQTLWPNGAN